jgi:hypothetical protein
MSEKAKLEIVGRLLGEVYFGGSWGERKALALGEGVGDWLSVLVVNGVGSGVVGVGVCEGVLSVLGNVGQIEGSLLSSGIVGVKVSEYSVAIWRGLMGSYSVLGQSSGVGVGGWVSSVVMGDMESLYRSLVLSHVRGGFVMGASLERELRGLSVGVSGLMMSGVGSGRIVGGGGVIGVSGVPLILGIL